MATVTGYTAQRMKQIEDTTVVDGDIVGDNLVLVTRAGTQIDAGSVRGAVGPVGPPGPTLPAGMVTMFAGATAPTGYLLCDGALINRADYPALFQAIGITWGAGDGSNTFQLPDFRSRFPVGKGAATWSDSLNEKGGSKDATLPQHSHPGTSHSHANNHQHPQIYTEPTWSQPHTHGLFNDHPGVINTSDGGYHAHAAQDGNFVQGSPGNVGGYLPFSAPANALPVSLAADTGAGGSHGHSVTIPAHGLTTDVTLSIGHQQINMPNYVGTTGPGGTEATGQTGASPIDANLPPYITVNYVIKT